jgi:hypothetical protein
MNIFYLHHDPVTCATLHTDKHVVKMILEYAQLLSTAHRALDGTLIDGYSKTGRKQKRYVLPDNRESILYTATHLNHPSAVWVRQSKQNYDWLALMLQALCREYTYRYGKTHKVEREGLLLTLMLNVPYNISRTEQFTQPTPAMPDEYKVKNDSIKSYINYYVGAKRHLANWKNRTVPSWYEIN